MIVRGAWPSRPTFDNYWGLDRLRDEMLRLLDNAGDNSAVTSSGVYPPLNVSHDDNHFFIRAEIPGIKADELDISVVRDRVTLAGRREIAREHERASYHRKERAEGSFRRTLALPAEVNADGVEARYADGILTLRLPKAEEAKPRQITVKS